MCAGWVFIAVLLALPVSTQSLADRRLPAETELSITLPVVGDAAVELAQRVLLAARVSFGIEKAPPTPTAAASRLDAPIVDRISLAGMTVGEALTELVSLDSRYTWYEVEGRIVVRSASQEHPAAMLQRQIGPLSLSTITPSSAVEALAHALSPARGAGGVFVVGSDVIPAGAAPRRSPEAPALVLAPSNTLLHALNAIGDALDGSWIVSYDAVAPTPESTTISFTLPSATVTALSATAMQQARINTPGRLMIPVTGDLGTVVSWFGLRTKTQTAFIRVVGDRREARTQSFAPLDLTGLKTGEALDRIVALDGRYEWTRDDGLYLVRPRRAIVDGTPLDMPVEEFAARGIGVDAILGRIIRLLKVEGASGGGAGQSWSGGPEERERQRLARERPLTFSARQTTVRGLLNELCKEEGTLSWRASLQPDLQRGLLVTLNLDSFEGWGVSRTFVAPPWEPPRK